MKRTGVEGGVPQAGMAGDWFDQVPAAAAVLAPDGEVLRINDEAAGLLGIERAGRRFAIDTDWFLRLRDQVARDGNGTIVIGRRRGRRRTTLEVRGRAGEDGSMVVLLRDCTSHMHARRARQSGERRLRNFLDRLPEPLLIEQDGEIAYLNEAAARLAGDSVAALQGQPLSRLLPEAVIRHIESTLCSRGGQDAPVESVFERNSQRAAVVHISATPMQYHRRRAVQLLLRDVTEQVQAESRLRSTHERLRLISDVVRDHAILNVDVSGRIVSWNATAERMTGWSAEDVIHSPFGVMTAEADEDMALLLDSAGTEGRVESEIGLRRRDGTSFRAHVTLAAQYDPSLTVIGYALVIRDLTERLRAEEDLRRSEEQLRHSQKMDAVGRLASGIAHDFNNVLTAIQGHVQFLLEDLPEDLPSREDAAEIRRAAERATQLTRQLLTFARRQPARAVVVDLNSVITDVEKLLRRLIRADIQLAKELSQIPTICADPGQLEQVIMNLVVNARDAMRDGGTITIRTSTLTLDESYNARGLDLPPGEYVQMSVTDTGCGISDEVQQHVFEPFFTTKTEGTGLGLSTVYGITKQAGGHVSVYSEEGIGTTFKIFLPVQTETARADQLPALARKSPVKAGSVLLVEDDDAVRVLVRRTLESRGFNVIEASNGIDALEAAEQAARIDVVVTDVMMPRMDGEDLAEHMLARYPDVGIVLMSGFPETTLTRNGRSATRRYFLEKPFTPEALVQAVGRAMEN